MQLFEAASVKLFSERSNLCNVCMRTIEAEFDVSSQFTTISDIHQGRSVSLFLFNSVIEIAMEIALSTCGNSCIGICSDKKPSDLEYADDVVLLSKLEVSRKFFTIF